MLVVEARDRPGGRVEAVTLPDGRIAQAGGEVFGPGHEAYRELVDELGLTVERSYVAEPGEMTWGLVEGIHVGDEPPWLSDAELADAERVQRAVREACRRRRSQRSVGPSRCRTSSTSISLGAWLRAQGALPAVRRRHELAALSLSCDSPERTSLLSELRKHAALGGDHFYDLELWEGLRVAEGSAEVALRMASELGSRLRLRAVVRRIVVSPTGVAVTLADGETVEAEAVVCAIPAGPLREVEISGLSDARLRSLRAQRHALAAKVVVAYDMSFWQESGQNGLAETEWLFGSTWPQSPGVLSLLVPPERFSAFLAAPQPARWEAVLEGLVALYGAPARRAGGDARAHLGDRPVHARIHRELGAGRLGTDGTAAWKPRAAFLRGRL